MMTSTFLDLGLAPAPTGLPGAPPMVAAGVAAPDFAAAMAGLLAGTAPAALAADAATTRQDLAAIGKMMPQDPIPKILFVADIPVCEMPAPIISTGPAATDMPADPDIEGEPVDLGEPQLEPALAWLMPPVAPPVPAPLPVSVAPTAASSLLAEPSDDATSSTVKMAPAPVEIVADALTAPITPKRHAVAEQPLPSVAPRDPATDKVGEPLAPIKAAPPPRRVSDVPDCEMPVGLPDSNALPTTDTLKPAESQPLPVVGNLEIAPVLPAAIKNPAPAPDPSTPVQITIAGPAPAPAARVRALPLPDIFVLQPPTPAGAAVAVPVTMPAVQRGTGEVPPTAAIKPSSDAAVRESSPTLSEARLRTAVVQRLEIQPIALPARDSGATLAAAAAIRAAPAAVVGMTEPTGNAASTISPLDLGQLAPIAAGAPAAAPVGAAQQAGIDLTRDPGLHNMIDRIEQLRDAFDARDTRIRLIPDALGPVDISVRRDADSDAVQVHFTAAEAGTRQLIADAQHRLVELADARGVRIERATIDNGSGQQASSGSDQSRQQQHAQTAQQPRTPTRAARDAESDSTDQRIA